MSIVTGSQPFIAPFQSTNKDFGSVLSEFLSTQQKNIVKLVGYATGWTSLGLPDQPVGQLAGRVSGFMGEAKNVLSAIEIPGKASSFHQAASKFIAEPTLDSGRVVAFKELPGLVSPICDTVSLCHKFLPLSSEAMQTVKNVSSTFTLISSGHSALEQIQKIHQMEEINPKRTALYLNNLARDVSYVAVAVLGLIGLSGWVLLACLTSGLVFTITGFFYDRIVVNADGKHTDLNKVNANLRAELAYLSASPRS
jgi:hypothetical protein